jgi:1-aminocyclopropane-1-carboxylate deaminase/D-cysteine desulfhydrase-like pyridoxal-dependent ACC family enzyme
VICNVFQGFGAVSGYDLTGKAGIDQVRDPADVIDVDCSIKQSKLSILPYMAFLSLLTKIVSGYWHLSDFQSGYVAISKKALETVDWQQMYKRYGQPNDQLILLNVYNFRVQDVPVDPVYHVGEVSGIKIKKVMFTLGWLLVNRSIRAFL